MFSLSSHFDRIFADPGRCRSSPSRLCKNSSIRSRCFDPPEIKIEVYNSYMYNNNFQTFVHMLCGSVLIFLPDKTECLFSVSCNFCAFCQYPPLGHFIGCIVVPLIHKHLIMSVQVTTGVVLLKYIYMHDNW